MLDPTKSTPAIQTDPKVLLKEIQDILDTGSVPYTYGPTHAPAGLDTTPIILPTGNKCTCPIKLKTKKKGRGLPIRKQTNGYSDYCPIHTPSA